MFQLVFTRRYAMAHRLIAGCSKKCATPHGHNEFVTVIIEGVADTRLDHHANMVAEFTTVKKVWHQWIDDHVDHAFQAHDRDPLLAWSREHAPDWRLLITPGDPTTEMLAAVFMAKLNAFLEQDGRGMQAVEVKIEETPTNTVLFRGDPYLHLPRSSADVPPTERRYWWERPDMTTHDLTAPLGGSGSGTAVPSGACSTNCGSSS